MGSFGDAGAADLGFESDISLVMNQFEWVGFFMESGKAEMGHTHTQHICSLIYKLNAN